MALGDITVKDAVDVPAAITYNVSMGATAINAGEPVQPSIGGQVGVNSSSVIAAVTSSPNLSTSSSFLAVVGIAQTNSTQTTTVNGTVGVLPVKTGVTYLIKPKTAGTWDTQAKYDVLVGSRVTLDLTAGSYTINATDGYANGCVIMPLDVAKNPGKVAFQFRPGASYLGGI